MKFGKEGSGSYKILVTNAFCHGSFKENGIFDVIFLTPSEGWAFVPVCNYAEWWHLFVAIPLIIITPSKKYDQLVRQRVYNSKGSLLWNTHSLCC